MFGIVAITLAAVALGGCSETSESSVEGYRSFNGTVMSFEAESLLELESITVANAAGVVLDFHAGGRRFEEFTPAHVREHMLLGDPVEVTYRQSGDVLIIVSLQDASDGSFAPSGSP